MNDNHQDIYFEKDTLDDMNDETKTNNEDSISEDDDENTYSSKNDHHIAMIILIPLIRLFILLPGKLTRIILQIGDLYYFIQILNITVDYIVIILVGSVQINKIAGMIFTTLFSLLLGNLLTVPAWEIFQLRWIQSYNPLQTFFNIWNLQKYYENYDTTLTKINKITNFGTGIFFYFYLWAIIDFMKSKGKVFDIMNLIVLLFIPGIKFLLIYISLIYKLIENISKCKIEEKSSDEVVDDIENDNNGNGKLTINNQYKNIHDPFILAKLPMKNLTIKHIIFQVIKSIIILAEFIFLIIIYKKKGIKAGGIVFSLIVFIYISLFSELISMPIWIINIFHRWDFCKCINAIEGTNEKIRMNPLFNGFKYVCLICQFLPPILVIGLIIIEINRSNSTYFYTLSDEVKWNGVISENYPYIPPILTVKSSMCFTKIYGLSLIQIASIAAAPYYLDNDNFKHLISNSFFKDENFEIKLNFLKKEDDHPVLLQADFDNDTEDFHLTIFSVRGSRTPVDWWLDVEMFVSSAMLTVARWVPFLQRQEGNAYKFISNFMTFPLTLMAEATYTYKYINEMSPHITKFINDSSNSNRNILFTGHSLGGGLSKVLAHKYQFQSVAVSGPGISPIEDYVSNKENDNDIYFKSKLVDIVPDRDIVPRFETSGGTKYRVLCNQNVGECHNKFRTVCQMGISCDDEYHVGDFCSHLFSEKEYKEMKDLAHR